LLSNRITPLMQLDSMFSFQSNKAQLGYALARSAADFFVQQYGVEKLYDIINHLNQTPSLNKNFLAVTGKDFIDFEVKWYDYIDKEYKWFFLLNAENIVWVVLLILLGAAYLRIKLKNRKTQSSWKEETDSEEY